MWKHESGVCPRDENGNRKHEYVMVREVYGHNIVSCKHCGNFPLDPIIKPREIKQ
jgi:hypothetical protein